MSQTQILVLGAIAGLAIFIGLPVGRIGALPAGASAFLTATATGILLFLFWDVLSAGIEPVEAALTAAALDDTGSWSRFADWPRSSLRLRRRPHEPGLLRRADRTTATSRRPAQRRSSDRSRRGAPGADPPPAQSLSLMIATGIGLHKFSEGLAIGQSAAAGEISLALVLVIGFGLHNATEGFGIVGPLCASRFLRKAAWPELKTSSGIQLNSKRMSSKFEANCFHGSASGLRSRSTNKSRSREKPA